MQYPQEWYNKPDIELVRLAKANPDYFAIIMIRYKDALTRYIKRIAYFNNEDIEDILQEIFIKVYKNLNDYDETMKFSSWIYRITHNHVIDQFRKSSSKLSTTSIEDNELIHFLKSSVNIEKDIEQKECIAKVRALIEEMPLKYREILVLRFLEEKDYEEIMDILRKPKGTVATLINRGKKILKEKLDEANIKCFS
jgi:RNA polymerase sigma-70 factor (ECF subfamily)